MKKKLISAFALLTMTTFSNLAFGASLQKFALDKRLSGEGQTVIICEAKEDKNILVQIAIGYNCNDGSSEESRCANSIAIANHNYLYDGFPVQEVKFNNLNLGKNVGSLGKDVSLNDELHLMISSLSPLKVIEEEDGYSQFKFSMTAEVSSNKSTKASLRKLVEEVQGKQISNKKKNEIASHFADIKRGTVLNLTCAGYSL